MLCKDDLEIIELCLNATRTNLIRNDAMNDDLTSFQKQLCRDRTVQIEKTLEKVRKM